MKCISLLRKMPKCERCFSNDIRRRKPKRIFTNFCCAVNVFDVEDRAEAEDENLC